MYLLGQPPPDVPWESRWLRWPDFRLPADQADVLPTLTEAWQRAATERVEIACAGGRGRTGTALACLAVLDGIPSASAVAFVREHYDRRAVETFRQRRYVARWRGRETMQARALSRGQFVLQEVVCLRLAGSFVSIERLAGFDQMTVDLPAND